VTCRDIAMPSVIRESAPFKALVIVATKLVILRVGAKSSKQVNKAQLHQWLSC
jgi:hypothetical protein